MNVAVSLKWRELLGLDDVVVSLNLASIGLEHIIDEKTPTDRILDNR